MNTKIKTIRGMNDILPEATRLWRYVEEIVRDVVESYGYREIRVPLIEYTDLFKRSIGEVSDIVEKEMYTFKDRNDGSLTLRPEATASLVRAGLTNGLLHNQKQKLWTSGPMFRYEKPQQGRYRQFSQFDVEAMGYFGPDVDVELIIMRSNMWKRLGISQLTLEINSLGSNESRSIYRQELIQYFEKFKQKLDQDSIRRLEKNPLRILDSKNPEMHEIIKKAPKMLDYLDPDSAQHFSLFKDMLDQSGIKYVVNPRLVRGLDYYNRTVFEWVTDALGAQGAVCSGGRYDTLVEKLGGRSTPAIGWAMGMERLISLYEKCVGKHHPNNTDVFIVAVGEDVFQKSLELSERLRDSFQNLRVEVNLGGGGFKSQLKKADKSGASYAIIIGENELQEGTYGLKPLRSDENQVTISSEKIIEELEKKIENNK